MSASSLRSDPITWMAGHQGGRDSRPAIPNPVYPASAVVRARELREAGWTYKRITELLMREVGSAPHHTTLSRWCDPDQGERHRATSRARQKLRRQMHGNGGRIGLGHHTPAFQEDRCVALLTTAGMRATQVARALDFDYPDQGWNTHRVRTLAAAEEIAA